MSREKLVDSVWYNVSGVKGPLLFARRQSDVVYNAIVEITTVAGETLYGQVLDLSEETVVMQVLGSTHGVSVTGTALRYSGEVQKLPVSKFMLGRILDGKGKPLDGLPLYPASIEREITGAAINPVCREVPDEYVETGVTAIDLMNTLVKGQKLPIFSCAGLPSNELAALIVGNASNLDDSERELYVVFAGMGITHREYEFFLDKFTREGALDRTVVFLNRADEPVIERLLAPRCALTAAEYLAFDLGLDVLVILTDMTHYCEALREVSSAREEIAGRRGYPGYMYTDLAGLYERVGRICGKGGSVTQIPILTMPDDDITHPIADLTGYITEGQIVLDRSLFRREVRPPINPLPSLSRLMDKVAGKSTYPEHKAVSDQLYSLYARAAEVRRMAELVGRDNLSPYERSLLGFSVEFEEEVLNQKDQPRTLKEGIELAMGLFAKLNDSLLDRISPEMLAPYRKGKKV
ncbi:V-type ATP synthase subunit B [bacterium]|nr:MAG: V-type ATP synthase subunit B [bacterium]